MLFHGWVQAAAAEDTLMTIPLWIVVILPVAKILVEIALYPLSFYVQRKYVFPPESEEVND